MSKYLYGAAVQGIQQFIFQSTELREIASASALVEEACTETFAECLYDKPYFEHVPGEKVSAYQNMLMEFPDSTIINAAGNVKFLFDDNQEELCKKVVLKFPKMVSELIPGITISQAVVKLPNGTVDEEAIDELERKLREQRNRVPRNTTLGLMGTVRCRKTGKPAVAWVKDPDNGPDIAIDKATQSKQTHNLKDLVSTAFGENRFRDRQLPFEIEDIEGRQKWIAIIHADGNGLGQVVRKVGHNTEDFRTFSKGLAFATKQAVRKTFDKMVDDGLIKLQDKDNKPAVLPIRPVVLGGDDVTVICRADLALDFVNILANKFQEETTVLHKILTKYKVFEGGEDHLTLCAGIAYVKSNYPFHFGYDLAENLCSVAKKDARLQKTGQDVLIPACAAFHKVQDSFIESYEDIRSRELRIEMNQRGIEQTLSFEYGPYYLKDIDGRRTIKDLLEDVKALNGQNKLAHNAMREWLAYMSVGDDQKAVQHLERMLDIKVGSKNLIGRLTNREERGDLIVFQAYDVMSLTPIYKKD